MTNNEHAIQYSRGTSYYKLKAKYESLSNAHRLYKRQIELWDRFYLLDVITYGELQRNYRSFGNSTEWIIQSLLDLQVKIPFHSF